MGRLDFFLVGAAVLGLSTGCSPRSDRPEGLRVVASILPLYCFVAQVAGERASVDLLAGGSVGPHDFQFSPKVRRQVNRADMLFITGLGLEPWSERLEAAVGREPFLVKVGEGLEARLLSGAEDALPENPGHQHGKYNPHFWQDPHLAMAAVSNIVEAFCVRDPAHAPVYRENGGAYLARLRALDEELEERLRGVRDVPFLTYHDAFPYLARRYQLSLVGVVEQVADVQPSLQDMGQLIQMIRDRQVRALFTEPQFSSKLARQISADTGVPMAELDPLETGPAQGDAYEVKMRANAATLARTLK